jgi:uncharacterized protein YdeI (YjbR/CyaY-like superfamily)
MSKARKKEIPEIPIVAFPSEKAFETWLGKNYSSASALWIRFFKKGSGIKTIAYAEALDVALQYGWIDSQLKTYDAASYLQKFTPRGSKSIWSKINTQHVERLIKEKKMKPAGMAQVEAAKKDGRWQSAYSSSKNMEIPADFLKELKKNKAAFTFFKLLNKANVYAIAWRLHTAKKPETRLKRMKAILEMLASGKSFH